MLAWLLMVLIGVPILLPLAVVWLSVRLLPLMNRVLDANRRQPQPFRISRRDQRELLPPEGSVGVMKGEV